VSSALRRSYSGGKLKPKVIETLLWYLSAALCCAAAVRLGAAGLAGRYPALTLLLLLHAARSFLLIYYQSNYSTYAWVYVFTTPLMHAMHVWAGLEIYRHVFEAYSGLSVLGRRSLALAAAAGTILAFGYVHAGSRVAGEPFPVLRFVLLFEASIACVVLFFLVTLIGFMLWFPVPLRRNVMGYAAGLCVSLAMVCAGVAMRVFAGHETRSLASTVIVAASAVVYGYWAVTFGQAGERTLSEGALPRSPDDQARLLNQLKALNAMVQSARNS